jgi:hypothetical protein
MHADDPRVGILSLKGAGDRTIIEMVSADQDTKGDRRPEMKETAPVLVGEVKSDDRQQRC